MTMFKPVFIFILFFISFGIPLTTLSQDNCMDFRGGSDENPFHGDLYELLDCEDGNMISITKGYVNNVLINEVIKYDENLEPEWSLLTKSKSRYLFGQSKEVLFGIKTYTGKKIELSSIHLDGTIDSLEITLEKKEVVKDKFTSDNKLHVFIEIPGNKKKYVEQTTMRWLVIDSEMQVEEKEITLSNFSEKTYNTLKRDLLYVDEEYLCFSTSYVDYSNHKKGKVMIVLEKFNYLGELEVVNLNEYIELDYQALVKWDKLGPKYRLNYDYKKGEITYQVIDLDGTKGYLGALDSENNLKWKTTVEYEKPITYFSSSKFSSVLWSYDENYLMYRFVNTNRAHYWLVDKLTGEIFKHEIIEYSTVQTSFSENFSVTYIWALMYPNESFQKELKTFIEKSPYMANRGYQLQFLIGKDFLYLGGPGKVCRYEND